MRNDQCAICLQNMDSPTFILPCMHVFCLACVSAWINVKISHETRTCPLNSTCPQCRALISGLVYDIIDEKTFETLLFPNADPQTIQTHLQTALTIHQSRQDEQSYAQLPIEEKRRLVYKRKLKPREISLSEIEKNALTPLRRLQGRQLRFKLESRIIDFIHSEMKVLFKESFEDWIPQFIESVLWEVLMERHSMIQLIEKLKELLEDNSEIFVEELLMFAKSRMNLKTFYETVQYE